MLNFTICVFFFFFWGGGASIYILGKEHIAALLHLTNSEAHYLEEKVLCRGLEMHRSINELMISQMIGLKRLKLINHCRDHALKPAWKTKKAAYLYGGCWPYSCVMCAFALSIVNLVDKWKDHRRNILLKLSSITNYIVLFLCTKRRKIKNKKLSFWVFWRASKKAKYSNQMDK